MPGGGERGEDMEYLVKVRSFFYGSVPAWKLLQVVISSGIWLGICGYLLSSPGAWAVAPTPPPQSVAVNGQTTHYPSGDASIEAYMAQPKGAGKHPAVIVVHDDRGLTQGIKDLTRLFGQSGFVA